MEIKVNTNKINIIYNNSNLIIGQPSNFSIQDHLQSNLHIVLSRQNKGIKIMSNKYSFPGKFCIDDLEKIDQIVKKVYNYKITTTIEKNYKDFQSSINKIKKKLTGSFVIPDLNNLYQKLEIINTYISEFPENHGKNQNITDNKENKIDKISDAIDQITKIIEKINSGEDILKEFRNIIINVIEKVVDLYRKILTENNNPDIESKIESKYLTSFFINDQQKYGLVFEQDVNKSHVNSGENLNQFLFFILNEYKKAIQKCTNIFNTNKVYDIDYYLQNEILYFINNFPTITEIDPKSKLNKNDLKEKIEKFQSNLKKYPTELDERQHGTDIYWHYLLGISKQRLYDSENFFYSIESILKYYKKYTNSNLLEKTCTDFINLYQKESKNIKSSKNSIEKIKEIFDLIQNQTKKYFYFDYFTLIFMNNLFNQKHYINKDQSDSMVDLTDPKEFTGFGFSYKINYNRKNLNFFLRIQFDKSFNNDEKNRQIKIFTENYSDHIVHIDSNDELKDIIPFFPVGTIGSILQNQNKNKNKKFEKKIELNDVDKIVILLEIAQALSDLHKNDEYHGNISDQIVFINSQLDAYIGSIYYNVKNESSSSISKGSLYYRSPEMFEKGEKTKEDFQSNDIYSYGVLMHELFTDISPEMQMRMKNIIQDQRLKKLKEDYCRFLFEDESSNGCFSDEKIKKFKEIIEKCLDKDKSKRYSNINDVIDVIKKTSLYQQNKEEVEYRISQSIKSSSYQCNISDIVLSYCKGQKYCKEYIELFIKKYKENEIQEDTETTIKSDIIENILELIGRKKSENNEELIEENILENIEEILMNLFSKAKNHEIQNFRQIINMFLESYKPNVGYNFMEESYEYLLKTLNIKDKRNTRNEYIKLTKILDNIQNNGKYYYIDFFYHFLLKNILKQDLFKSQLNKLFEETNRTINSFYSLRDSLSFNALNASYKIHYDGNFNFYLQKNYKGPSTNEVKREKRILNLKCSKFITPFYENKEENLDNKIYIPYFPNNTLFNMIRYQSKEQDKIKDQKKERRVELTNVDKIVILLEIAIALSDLHSRNEYHGNLSDQFIFINSQLDAYICSISFDKNFEGDSTKPESLFYYRDPSYFNNNGTNNGDQENDQQDQTNNDEFIKQKQKDDIYSYGVLMHELFTDTHPVYRMGNAPRERRINILKGDYFNFLTTTENNECFDENTKDSLGNNLSDFKAIIKKCLSKNKSKDESKGENKGENKDESTNEIKRYDNIKEVINSIKETSLYKQNQEEIDYRISHSVDCREYECDFSDIVESYLRGQSECYCDIEKMLSEYEKMNKKDSHLKVEIEGEIIKYIFEYFGIKYDEDWTYYFEDIFNFIIQHYINEKTNHKVPIDLDNKLLELSIKLHNNHKCSVFETCMKNKEGMIMMNGQNVNFILPVFTLDDLINKIDRNILPFWIYMITKELSTLHSKNLYHGELSKKTIGIYYYRECEIFVPFITLFYSFYKLTTGFNRQYLSELEVEKIKKLENKCMKNASYSNKDEKIQMFKEKDIKDFKKILNSSNYFNEILLEEISSLNTMNDIYLFLYKYLYKSIDEKQQKFIELSDLEMDYSPYQITYSTAYYLFKKAKSDDFYNNSFIIFKDITQLINEFLDNTKNNLNDPIIKNIPFTLTKKSDESNNEIIKKEFNEINQKCLNLFNEICTKDYSEINDLTPEKYIEDYNEAHKNDNKNINTYLIEKHLEYKSEFETLNYVEHKKIERKELMVKIEGKVPTRTIEFTNFTRKSLEFLLKRYINNLNPNINYYIQIKLNKKNDFDWALESFTPIDEVRRIASEFKRIKEIPYFDKNNIVIIVGKIDI